MRKEFIKLKIEIVVCEEQRKKLTGDWEEDEESLGVLRGNLMYHQRLRRSGHRVCGRKKYMKE